ncbi:MAG TPA: alpha/beta fold hydrolase [Solirubrobacteraceae bacterium]|nr:alpha/beta fold hydrolase [Solirubrobacteraceae bacterium]
MRQERRRDNQQWILDLMVKQTGRVQNFANDEREVPPEVKSYRMIPRALGKQAAHAEAIAAAAERAGHTDTARAAYARAAEIYAHAQHAIFQDDNREKIYLHAKHLACFEKVVAYAENPVELVEIPWEGVQIQGRLHLFRDHRRAPTVLFLPGMDMTKEMFPSPLANPYLRRGMNVLSIDGPGQGISNIRKIRVSDDNYERAASAAIDYLLERPEVDPDRIAVVGTSFGSHWGTRLAAMDHRMKALATTHAVYGPKTAIFEEASPRFKQMFMYMAGIHDEAEFDAMAERMTTVGYGARITCPTLMVTGEYDPLAHLEATLALFDEITAPKELWVFENEFHRVQAREGIAGLELHLFMGDWVRDALDGRLPADHSRIVLVPQHGGAGPYTPPAESLYLPGRPLH